MTIKIRNRITRIFFITSLIYFAIATILTIYKLLTNTLLFPAFHAPKVPQHFLFTNNAYAVIISIFVTVIYICFTTFIIIQNFQKTQATDMLFFLFFLMSILCDTFRIFVPLFHCAETYSNFLIAIANITLFGKILAPLSICAAVILSNEDFRKVADQNILIILITALFFANLIPINTAIILPNFSVSFGYINLLRTFSIIIFIISIVSLAINNHKNEYSQKSAIGLLLICTGYLIFTNGYSIFTAILSPAFLLTGTHFYMATIHRQYLWIN